MNDLTTKTIKNYFQYLVDAYLIFLLNGFSFKHKEQIKQPRKVYTIDNGLSAALHPKFNQNRGAALENLVFQELYRRGLTFTYYGLHDMEIDFVITDQKQVVELIQVAFELRDPNTRKREMKALSKAASPLQCTNLNIITWDEEGIENFEGHTIKIIPIWKWLLTR